MRDFFAKITLYTHFLIGTFWYSLFFIPTTWWPDRIYFHFCLSLVIVFHQFIWGMIITPWTGKYRMVCILTTLTQCLRKQKISDPNNYNHSFMKELLNKRGIRISHRMVTFLTFAVLTITTIQYFFFH